MPPRAYWKGHIQFSLINIPVRMYSATDSGSKVSLNQIYPETMERIKMKTFAGDKEVPRSELVKGYEYEKGKYVIIDEDDLNQIRLETDKTIQITQFIEADELDAAILGSPYYLAPDGPVAVQGYQVIQAALDHAGKVGIGRVVIHGKESLVALQPFEKGFRLTMLKYASEIRSCETYFEEIPDDINAEESQVQLAVNLIQQMSAPFEHDSYKDRYQESLLAIIQSKLDGDAPIEIQEEQASQVINFMDALKASLSDAETEAQSEVKTEGKRTKKATKKSAKKSAKKASQKAAAKKPPAKSATKPAKTGGKVKKQA